MESPAPESKALLILGVCKEVSQNGKCAYVEFENQKRYFCRVAQTHGYRCRTQKQCTGGVEDLGGAGVPGVPAPGFALYRRRK